MKEFDIVVTSVARSFARFFAGPERTGYSLLAVSLGVCCAIAWSSSSRATPTPASTVAASAPNGDAIAIAQGCERGDAVHCNDLGVSYLHGYAVPVDALLAFRSFERACEGGSPDGCSNLGALYEGGVGVEVGLEEAARRYEQACDMGGALGCSNLGALYAHGRGVARDLREARRLFTLACELGSAAGCSNLIQFSPPRV
jgi:hypothetical protein